jgi:Bacterial PH domain
VGFVLLGLVGLGLRTSSVELLVSVLVTGAALAGLARVLSMGVRATPTGLIVRDLTRTTLVPWTRVRGVTCERTDRRNVFAPVLHLAPERAVKGGRRGTGQREDVQITVLGSYREAVARRRTDEIEAARTGAVQRTR